MDISKNLFDLLVSKNFTVKTLDAKGKPEMDPNEASMFAFDFEIKHNNYGTVVILLNEEQQFEVYYGDKIGKRMEENKQAWYDFLYHLRMFAKRHRYVFSLRNINQLKYSMQGMAAIKEGLYEGWNGTKTQSYNNKRGTTRLMIKHNKTMGEDDQRWRAVDSLFIETSEGERFKLPFKSLQGGRAMARHVEEGGNPYDVFGEHITQLVREINTLGNFVRATRTITEDDDQHELVEWGKQFYKSRRQQLKSLMSKRGYHATLKDWSPEQVEPNEQRINELRDAFTKTSVDQRIEEALPYLAQLDEWGGLAGSLASSAASYAADKSGNKTLSKGIDAVTDIASASPLGLAGDIGASIVRGPSQEYKDAQAKAKSSGAKTFSTDADKYNGPFASVAKALGGKVTYPTDGNFLANYESRENNMKELNEFEQWADQVTEGTWAIPDTEQKKQALRDFMSQEQPVGIDAENATNQLYDIIGDDDLFDELESLAQENPDADARPVVDAWVQEKMMGFDTGYQWKDPHGEEVKEGIVDRSTLTDPYEQGFYAKRSESNPYDAKTDLESYKAWEKGNADMWKEWNDEMRRDAMYDDVQVDEAAVETDYSIKVPYVDPKGRTHKKPLKLGPGDTVNFKPGTKPAKGKNKYGIYAGDLGVKRGNIVQIDAEEEGGFWYNIKDLYVNMSEVDEEKDLDSGDECKAAKRDPMLEFKKLAGINEDPTQERDELLELLALAREAMDDRSIAPEERAAKAKELLDRTRSHIAKQKEGGFNVRPEVAEQIQALKTQLTEMGSSTQEKIDNLKKLMMEPGLDKETKEEIKRRFAELKGELAQGKAVRESNWLGGDADDRAADRRNKESDEYLAKAKKAGKEKEYKAHRAKGWKGSEAYRRATTESEEPEMESKQNLKKRFASQWDNMDEAIVSTDDYKLTSGDKGDYRDDDGRPYNYMDDETGELFYDKPEDTDGGYRKLSYDDFVKGRSKNAPSKKFDSMKAVSMFGDIAAGGGDPVDYLMSTMGMDMEEIDRLAQEQGFADAYDWADSYRDGDLGYMDDEEMYDDVNEAGAPGQVDRIQGLIGNLQKKRQATQQAVSGGIKTAATADTSDTALNSDGDKTNDKGWLSSFFDDIDSKRGRAPTVQEAELEEDEEQIEEAMGDPKGEINLPTSLKDFLQDVLGVYWTANGEGGKNPYQKGVWTYSSGPSAGPGNTEQALKSSKYVTTMARNGNNIYGDIDNDMGEEWRFELNYSGPSHSQVGTWKFYKQNPHRYTGEGVEDRVEEDASADREIDNIRSLAGLK